MADEETAAQTVAYSLDLTPDSPSLMKRGDKVIIDGVIGTVVDVRPSMPADPYRTCFECGHVYPTAADLLAEHAALVARINRESWPDTPPMVAQTDPDRVYACPACAHDF